jgi:hypothetical protein
MTFSMLEEGYVPPTANANRAGDIARVRSHVCVRVCVRVCGCVFYHFSDIKGHC